MPRYFPVTASTFGDCTSTGGDPRWKKEVAAQFRSDADFEWLRELRSLLRKPEVKYADFYAAKERLQANRRVWSRIQRGLGQSTIIVVDPAPYATEIAVPLMLSGLSRVAPEYARQVQFEHCATGIAWSTPIAFLHFRLAMTARLFENPITAYYRRRLYLEHDAERLSARAIAESLEFDLRAMKLFACRAHGLFDLISASSVRSTKDVFENPDSHFMLAEVVRTIRCFDRENKKTLPLLNHAVNEIALFLSEGPPRIVSESPLVLEVDSMANEEIQAADIAVGLARDLIVLNDDLAGALNRFEKVFINGVRPRMN